MEFGVLGPLVVQSEGASLPPGTPKRQLVLAQLVVNAPEAVTLDAMITELWGERPPQSAVANARGYAGALRRQLAVAQPGVERLVRVGSGYLLRVTDAEVDLQLFQRDVRHGKAARTAGDLPAAVAYFERGLSRWRGVMLDGLPRGPQLAIRCVAAERARLQVIDDLAEINLRLGRTELADQLMRSQLLNEPLREQSCALLMRARYRIDGAASALEVYEAMRANLAGQLGIEPGPELQRLHRKVLNRDADLDGSDSPAPRTVGFRSGRPGAEARQPAASTIGVSPTRAYLVHTPRALPPDVPDFVGRTRELALLREVLTRPARTSVAVVAGFGGVGKTALCIRSAYSLLDEYPGGQLYADLRGLDAEVATPFEVLGRFLRLIGIDDRGIPRSLDERAELYRSLLSERRVLVVLDNAASDDQVRPLIPGGRGCGVTVSSRARLGMTHGSTTIDLDVLEPAEAIQVIRNLVGSDRADAEPAAVAEVSRLCCRLPLALRIAGGRLAAKPHWSVRRLAGLLADERTRLDQLSKDRLDVRASIALSYRGLPPAAQELLRRLGDLAVPGASRWICTALIDGRSTTVDDALEELVDSQLLQVDWTDTSGLPRYRLPDLVRLFARERAEREDPPEVRRGAAERATSACPAVTEVINQAISGGDRQGFRGETGTGR